MNGGPDSNQWDIRLPDANAPLRRSHLRQAPKWANFMHEIDAEWRRFMREHDRPEDRLATKLPNRFQIDP